MIYWALDDIFFKFNLFTTILEFYENIKIPKKFYTSYIVMSFINVLVWFKTIKLHSLQLFNLIFWSVTLIIVFNFTNIIYSHDMIVKFVKWRVFESEIDNINWLVRSSNITESIQTSWIV